MKIIKQSATLLAIYLPRLLFRLVGVLFIGVGGLMVLATSQSIWLQLVLWLFPLAGVYMFFARRVTLTLNKTTNQFILSKQGILNRVENFYSLDAIEGVTIEENSFNQRKMYRVVFTMSNGTDVPINAYYDGLLAENIKLAKLVCTFLNLQEDFSSWEKKNRFQTYLAGGFLVAGLIMVIYLIFR